eukprot:COSAG02_NODE_12166_length_1586_cov_1.315400_1_plen_69_part_10
MAKSIQSRPRRVAAMLHLTAMLVHYVNFGGSAWAQQGMAWQHASTNRPAVSDCARAVVRQPGAAGGLAV